MGPGDVIPVKEAKVDITGAVLSHLPAADQTIQGLAAALPHPEHPATAPLQLTHLLSEEAVIKTGPAGIEATEEIHPPPRARLVNNGRTAWNAVVATRLLQRRSLPITLGWLVTLQALPLLAASPAPRVTLSGHHGQYTASVVVPVSAPKAWSVLTNYESMAGVMPDIQLAKVVSRSGRNLELAQTYKAPYTFGLSIKARLQVQETPPSKISYALISGDRIKQLQGSWTITPVKGGVLVKHQIQVVPQIPGFLLGTYYDLTETNLRQSMQILAQQMVKG